MTKKRILVAVLTALVLVVMLSSSLFIIEHADHDCIGEDCPICEQIYLCTQTLKTLSLAVIAAAVFYAFSALLSTTIRQVETACVPHTPVSLKVKLSN